MTTLTNRPVIIRSHTAGVHAGILEEMDPATCTVLLKDAYRLWRVYTRDKTGSVSDVAANGLKEPLDQHSIGAKLSRVVIVNPQGLEIAEMTDAAYTSVVEAAPKEG